MASIQLQKELFLVMWPGATVVRSENEPAACDEVQEYTALHNHKQCLGYRPVSIMPNIYM